MHAKGNKGIQMLNHTHNIHFDNTDDDEQAVYDELGTNR